MEFETYTNDTPPDEYSQLTYAYDLLDTNEAMMMERESKRLASKGIDVVWQLWDTRDTKERTETRMDHFTHKQSLYAAIWVGQVI